jgi:hypothetical protein
VYGRNKNIIFGAISAQTNILLKETAGILMKYTQFCEKILNVVLSSVLVLKYSSWDEYGISIIISQVELGILV